MTWYDEQYTNWYQNVLPSISLAAVRPLPFPIHALAYQCTFLRLKKSNSYIVKGRGRKQDLAGSLNTALHSSPAASGNGIASALPVRCHLNLTVSTSQHNMAQIFSFICTCSPFTTSLSKTIVIVKFRRIGVFMRGHVSEKSDTNG